MHAIGAHFDLLYFVLEHKSWLESSIVMKKSRHSCQCHLVWLWGTGCHCHFKDILIPFKNISNVIQVLLQSRHLTLLENTRSVQSTIHARCDIGSHVMNGQVNRMHLFNLVLFHVPHTSMLQSPQLLNAGDLKRMRFCFVVVH